MKSCAKNKLLTLCMILIIKTSIYKFVFSAFWEFACGKLDIIKSIILITLFFSKHSFIHLNILINRGLIGVLFCVFKMNIRNYT